MENNQGPMGRTRAMQKTFIVTNLGTMSVCECDVGMEIFSFLAYIGKRRDLRQKVLFHYIFSQINMSYKYFLAIANFLETN
jgi:hypothetical protein